MYLLTVLIRNTAQSFCCSGSCHNPVGRGRWVQKTQGTPIEDCRETCGFTAHDAQLQNSLCGVLTKTRCILPFKPALRNGKGQACFILALLEYKQPFLEWAARAKTAFPAPVTCFTSILCGYFQFLLFTLIFILKTMQHTPRRCMRRTRCIAAPASRSLGV